MVDRRQFLGALVLPAAVSVARARPGAMLAALERASGAGDDESFWFEIARAFSVDRSLVNLNNGGVSPSPAIVQDAMKAHLDFSNKAPVHTMWKVLEPGIEGVRARLARLAGVDPEELAITRNASEGLETCQLGLDLERGDEVLTTTQDYPRMVWTFRQRERREGIVLKQFPIPAPLDDPDEVVRRFEANIGPRTKLILVSHVVFLNGAVLPAREVVALGRKHGIPVIVDGAHAFAHLDFKIGDLDCDYYASSLHKWLFAPHGTGMLHVRRDKIPGIWPLMAAPEKSEADIRKFEEIGTHPAANHLAIAEALVFHEGIGARRKEQRLVELKLYWAERLRSRERVRFHTSLAPGRSGGIATVEILGVDPAALADWLWEKHKIIVVAIKHDEFQGIRVSPSVYTLKSELDRFGDALEHVLTNGLPS